MDCIVHGISKSWTRLNDFHFTSLRYEEMQGLGSWNQFLRVSNYLKTCSTSFPGAQSASLSPLNFPQGLLKGGNCSSTEFSLCRGRGKQTCVAVWSLANALGKCQLVVDRSTRLGVGDHFLSLSWICWRGQLSLTSFNWVCSSPGALGLGGLQGYTAWSLQALISAYGHWTLDSRQWCWHQGQKEGRGRHGPLTFLPRPAAASQDALALAWCSPTDGIFLVPSFWVGRLWVGNGMWEITFLSHQ